MGFNLHIRKLEGGDIMCYGEHFRKMREEKKMSIVEVSEGILSVSQLSKFERGLTEISISKFIKVLERINVTLSEFELVANNFESKSLYQMVEDLRASYTNRESDVLTRMVDNELNRWKKTENIRYRYNYIMLSIINDELNNGCTTKQSDIELLTDYLFSIEDWTYYELILFGNSIPAIPIRTVILLCDELLNKTSFFQKNTSHRKMVIHTLVNASIICLLNDEDDDSYRYQQDIAQLINSETYLYEKTVLMYCEGLYLLKQNRATEGTKKINKALTIFKDLESFNLADSYLTYLDEIVKKLS